MGKEFLVQMRQSIKCGSVRNDEIFNLHLGSGVALESASLASFTGSIRPNNYPEKNKEPRNEIQLTTYRIVLPWPMYTEPRTKRGRRGTQPQER